MALAQLGTRSFLVEQNEDTIRVPKMDVTNARSMEILRAMGLADEYRQLGPKEELEHWLTPFTTGMGEHGHHLFTWPLEGNKAVRRRINTTNDGTTPTEPPLRSSQIVLEAFLKEKCTSSPLITCKFGWKFDCCTETTSGVVSTMVEVSGTVHMLKSRYLVGSDGASSAVRKHLGIQTSGYKFPVKFFMTFFQSNELAERRHFGHFWHIVTPKGFLVDTNAGNLFASHHIFAENDDPSALDPIEVAQSNLGGAGEPWKFRIDKILAHSVWQPQFRCADSLSTPSGNIFLVGDAAHAVPPHGGHSLNTGILGMWNLSWKLAAVVNGWGGSELLQSYNTEMRPIAMEIINAVGGHITRQHSYSTLVTQNLDIIDKDTPEGEKIRRRVGAMIRDIGNHGRFYGRELDQRLRSDVIFPDAASDESKEPVWDPLQYNPSTWPGMRAPHVWLQDGQTSLFDHYGLWWTLVGFQNEHSNTKNEVLSAFQQVAYKLSIPLKTVELNEEDHARRLWERDFVLVRPDGHVAWRSSGTALDETVILRVLKVVSGMN
ncbi:FAD binding domain-containing [Pyrenophora seminiperda CCB06]|uniref:FAD binding domain-containing n=1 Tax=Pyrenophora seminiperda CCB06 TaxID=1302712 RepID=A0A3M7M659_9PLEO|nr:FAD binding domain-containing [Pyrenophora seminiperda CCB06]